MATRGWSAPTVLVVVLSVVGGLALLGQLQTMERQQATQREQAQVYLTATAAATHSVALFATEQAEGRLEDARMQATADRLVATQQASLTAIAVSVHATMTTMASRR